MQRRGHKVLAPMLIVCLFRFIDPPPRDFGYQVFVSLEQSQKATLPISPLMLEPVRYNMLGWDSRLDKHELYSL